MRTKSTAAFALLIPLLAASCLPTSFGGGGQPASRKDEVRGKDDANPRPTEGDESLPGYFLSLPSVAVEGNSSTRRVRVSAPAGSFAPGRAPRVALMRISQDELTSRAPYPADALVPVPYVILIANQLVVVAPAADGSFSVEANFDDAGGDLLMLTTEGDDGGKVVVRQSSRTTAGVREPFASGALRPLTFGDVAKADPSGDKMSEDEGGDESIPAPSETDEDDMTIGTDPSDPDAG